MEQENLNKLMKSYRKLGVLKTKIQIVSKIKTIIKECGNYYGSVQSPRAKSKLMALEWVLGLRSDI